VNVSACLPFQAIRSPANWSQPRPPGVVYDEEHDTLRTVEAAIEEARRTIRIVAKEQGG
jgi:hypothetical protein